MARPVDEVLKEKSTRQIGIWTNKDMAQSHRNCVNHQKN